MKNNTNRVITVKTRTDTSRPSLLLVVLSSVFLTVILSACSFPTLNPRTTLESEPFSGTIVDEETGKPIANAVVMIKWPKVSGTIVGSNTSGSVEVSESVTDAAGRYSIAGWLKKDKEEISDAFIYKNDPVMTIYAQGYWPTNKRNTMYSVHPLIIANNLEKDIDVLPRGEAWKAEWDGEAIGLKPMHSEEWQYKQWKEYGDSIGSYLSYYFIPVCGWLKLPNYYLARDWIERKAYIFAYPSRNYSNMGTNLSSMLTRWRISLEKECGIDPKTFFLSHGMTNKEFDECCSDDPTKRADRNTYISQPIKSTVPPAVANPSGGKK